MTYELKDWLNSINLTKENLLEADPTSKKSYSPYIINRCLSGHLDCVVFVNEMNKYHFIDKDLQYSFYLNTVRKRKRFPLGLGRIRLKIWIMLNDTMVIVMRKHCKS